MVAAPHKGLHPCYLKRVHVAGDEGFQNSLCSNGPLSETRDVNAAVFDQNPAMEKWA